MTTPVPAAQRTGIPAEATEAAHAAAYSLTDDLKLHIEAAQADEGCITSKSVRLALRLAADAAVEAAAPAIRDQARAEIPSLTVNIDGELTEEQVARIKLQFLEAVRTTKPAVVLSASAAEKLITTQAERVAELEQLAAEILATFTKGSDGYRARAGQVQIAKWETTLKGPSS